MMTELSKKYLVGEQIETGPDSDGTDLSKGRAQASATSKGNSFSRGDSGLSTLQLKYRAEDAGEKP